MFGTSSSLGAATSTSIRRPEGRNIDLERIPYWKFGVL